MDLSDWIGVGLGGNCDCRCGILYAPMLGWALDAETCSFSIAKSTII